MQEKKVRKIRNLIGTILLISSLAVTQLPIAGMAAVKSTESDFQMDGTTLIGYTGTATTVSVPDFIKTIGAGAFSGDTDLYTVHLPDGLETIGTDAFAGCRLLTVVDIPDSLKEIGSFAFSGCESLMDVQLQKDVAKIGDGAFAGCKSLSDISFSKENTHFSSYGGALYNSDKTKLYQVYAGSEYTKYTMPQSVKEMRPYAFWGCDRVRFAYLSSNIKDIPMYGFSNCALEEITLPYSVKNIGVKAFADCKSLQKAEIPPAVTYIHETAFDGCPKLTIVAEEGSEGKKFDDGRDKSAVAAAEYEDTSARSAGASYPQSAAAAQSVTGRPGLADSGSGQTVPAGGGMGAVNTNSGSAADSPAPGVQVSDRVLGQTPVVGGSAFVFIDNSANVYGNAAASASGRSVPAESGGQESAGNAATAEADNSGLQFPDSGTSAPQAEAPASVEDSPEAENGGAEKEQGAESDVPASGTGADYAGYTGGMDGKKGGFPKYTIVGDRIAAQAFYKDSELNSYEIPEQIKRIGDFAFSRSGLASITIPEGVEAIGYGAFYHCDGLKEVIIPSSVKEIEASAFDKTPWLENWQSGGNVNNYMVVGDGILLAYKGKESKITVPEGVKQIGPGVFKDHKGITSVSLPNTLKVIGEDAFAGCSNLTAVSGGVKLEQVGDRAFDGCPLETIRIPQTVTEIGLLAYRAPGSADSGNAVVFMGSTLPKVSYGKASTRLSNEDYRGLSFDGVQVAVVSDSIKDYTGTVLDEKLYGFRGLICSVQQEAAGGQEGILKVKSSTLGDMEAPESVVIYGSKYRFADPAGSAAGNTSAGGEALTEGEAQEGASEQGTQQQAAAVRVLANSDVLPENAAVTALLPEQTGSFYLSIRDSSEAKQQIMDAYHTLYGSGNDPLLYGFEITLYDSTMSIPLSRLGNSAMKIKMPLPEGVGPSNLHIVCTDEDGQLEDLDYQYYTLDGKGVVEFNAKHFSPFGIYQYSGDGHVAADDGNPFTASTRRKDASPDTGDWIHPKWFLAVGLFASAMVAFFGGRKRFPLFIRTGR